MKRIMTFLVEIIGAFLMCVMVGIVALILRLDRGPISLERMLPEIQSAISDMSPGLDFKIETAQVETNSERRAIRVRLKNISVVNEKQEVVGTLKEATLGFNWRNLVNFTPVPVAMEIIQPSIEITRFENGSIGFNLREVEAKEKPVAPIEEITDLLTKMPRIMRHIRILEAELRYDDRKDGYKLMAHKGLFDFHRFRTEISGTMTIDIEADDFKQKLSGTIAYDPDKNVTKTTVAIKKFKLDQIRGLVNALPKEVQFDMPVDIIATASIGGAMQPVMVDVQLTGKKGKFVYAPYFPKELAIRDLMGLVRLYPLEKKIELKTLMVKADKIQLYAKGDAVRVAAKDEASKPTTDIKLRALGENVILNDLDKYWPQGMAKDARDWVTVQIRDGVAHSAVIGVDLSVDAEKQITLKMMRGKIEFTGVTVDYLPPMPIVKNVDGTARFDHDNFNIFAKSGNLFETKVQSGDVRISGLSQEHQYIDINLNTNGPIKDAITTISSKPLEYAQAMHLTPDQFSGISDTNLQLYFPLLHALKLSQVEMKTKAALSDAVIRKAVKDLDVSAKTLALDVDTESLRVEGDAKLADAPVTLKWQEFFGENVPSRTTIDVAGPMSLAVLKGLRLPAEDYFSGTAQTTASISTDLKGTTSVKLDADLTKALIVLPELKVGKKEGVPGKLALNLTTDKSGVTIISNGAVSWNNFSVNNGAMRFSDANGLESAVLKGMRLGSSKADVTISPLSGNGIRAVVNADTLDLSGFMDKKKDPNAKPSTRKIDLSLRAKTLYLNPDVPLSVVRADVLLVGNELIRGTASGQTDQNGSFALRQTVARDNSRNLTLKIYNTGRVLQALDILEAVRDGTLTVVGQSTAQEPGVIKGALALEKFSLVKAPIMARLINALSPGGLLNLLNTSGLNFSKLESNITLNRGDTIKLSKGKMAGDSLGLSFSGTVDRRTDEVNIKGTIIPIEGLNKLAGKIPVIGQILTGLKSNGIFGATYKVQGPGETASVSVNPLSALAPGILRSIFFEGSDD